MSLQEPKLIKEMIEYEKTNQITEHNVESICNKYTKKISNTDSRSNKHSKKIGLVDTQITCIICLENLQVGKYKRDTQCGHTFHKTCIDSWLREHKTCPTCRRTI